jgi:hypothetical protein
MYAPKQLQTPLFRAKRALKGGLTQKNPHFRVFSMLPPPESTKWQARHPIQATNQLNDAAASILTLHVRQTGVRHVEQRENEAHIGAAGKHRKTGTNRQSSPLIHGQLFLHPATTPLIVEDISMDNSCKHDMHTGAPPPIPAIATVSNMPVWMGSVDGQCGWAVSIPEHPKIAVPHNH